MSTTLPVLEATVSHYDGRARSRIPGRGLAPKKDYCPPYQDGHPPMFTPEQKLAIVTGDISLPLVHLDDLSQ